MKKSVQKRLLIVGGVVGLGIIAYYLYDKSQQAPAIAPGPTPQPLPPKVINVPPKATPGQVQAYKTAVDNLIKFQDYIRANPPQNQAELEAAAAHAERFKQAVRAAAAAAGVPANV